jgi:membrane-associated protein
MTILDFVINLIFHVDTVLIALINTYGQWVDFFAFLIVFCETGLVVFPFLPGDSLIFIAGALSGQGTLNLGVMFAVFTSAAILGDAVNYSIGYYIAPRMSRFLKKEYLDIARDFYVRHGKATIFLARFVPIVRTFAPFLAGIGKMRYREFVVYNVLGGLTWVAIFIIGGYFFGGIPLVRDNLSLFLIAIIIISLVPTAIKLLEVFGKNRK